MAVPRLPPCNCCTCVQRQQMSIYGLPMASQVTNEEFLAGLTLSLVPLGGAAQLVVKPFSSLAFALVPLDRMMVGPQPVVCEDVLAAVQCSTVMVLGILHVVFEILQRRAFLAGVAVAPDDALGVRSHVGVAGLLNWPLGSSTGVQKCIAACALPILGAVVLWHARSAVSGSGGTPATVFRHLASNLIAYATRTCPAPLS
jgi:hypothetical protein